MNSGKSISGKKESKTKNNTPNQLVITKRTKIIIKKNNNKHTDQKPVGRWKNPFRV